MKYEVFIDGGFTGFRRSYQGELLLGNNEKKEIFRTLKHKPKPSNDIRDGFQYHVKLVDGDIEYNTVFDELNLPSQIRRLIDLIKLKARK